METIYYNGNIITMEDDSIPSAIYVKDGIIEELGDFDKLVSKHKSSSLFDLNGLTLLPGFIDPHSHFTQVAMSLVQVNLDGVKTLCEIKDKLLTHCKNSNVQKGEWIIANGFDNNFMEQGQVLTIAFLDKLFPDNPIEIQYKSGHMGQFNSSALNYLQITLKTAEESSGQIEMKNGKITGYLLEGAFFSYAKKVPTPSVTSLLGAYKRAQSLYQSYGITTFQEGYVVKQMLPFYDLLIESKMLKNDLIIYPDEETMKIIKDSKYQRLINKYDNHIKIGGMKAFIDGSPQQKTAYMKTPYLGSKDNYGTLCLTKEELERQFEVAYSFKLPLLVHSNGDAACQLFLDALSDVSKKIHDILSLPNTIIHAQFITKDELEYANKLKCFVSFFVGHIYYYGEVHIKNFGLERASLISPSKDALDLKVPFTYHTDSPVIMPNLLEAVWCGVNRVTSSGRVLGKEERISPYDALKAITITAAKQYSEEKIKGSIKVGKVADFVVLAQNPLKVDPMKIKDIDIVKTIKHDEVVYSNKSFED